MRNLNFFSLLLASLPFTTFSRTSKSLLRCDDVFKNESSSKWSDVASITSIFEHVFKTGCLICSKPKCENEAAYCNQESETTIPMYNNLFEFGLSGKYFPEGGSLTIHYKKNDSCYLKLILYQDREKRKFGVNFNQCYVHAFDKVKRCFPESKRIEYNIEFNNQFCLYFGIAFVEESNVYIATSPHCNVFASANFDYSAPYMLKTKNCYFNKEEDKPTVTLELRQPQDRDVEGVPIILPCSPGGFVADPKSGRFVLNEICWKMFGDSKRENVGINFLIKKLYNGNEHLLFPYGGYRSEKKMNPVYIDAGGKALDRDLMAPKIETNKLLRNRTRVLCEYVKNEDVPYVSVSEYPQTTPDNNGSNITVSTISPVTENPRTGEGSTCFHVLDELKPTRIAENPEDKINAYIHGEVACFVCAEPKCNYTDSDCQLEAGKEIPIYNNIFEFGLSGRYMPEHSDIRIILNKNCFLKLETFIILGNVTFYLQECSSFNGNKQVCRPMNLVGYEDKILFNNWYCPQIALALHINDRIFYGFSFRCDKFASSQLNESIFEFLRYEECYTNRKKTDNMKAIYSFKQRDLYTVTGVPIMIPCSPGGYAVDPRTGRFTVNQTCDDIFWETKRNAPKPSGIHFIINSLFNSNEHLIFKSRKDVSAKYPAPIYTKIDGTYQESKEMIPEKKKNPNIQEMYREKCLFIKKTDTDNVDWKNATKTTDLGDNDDVTVDSKSATDAPDLEDNDTATETDTDPVDSENARKATDLGDNDIDNPALLQSENELTIGEKGGEDTNDSDIFPINNNILITAQMLCLFKFKYFK